MNVQRFNFQEFDGMPKGRKAAKPFLPTGRSREEVPPPPPPPTFNEEQLKAAERESYKKGFLEGTEEGRKQAESEQAQTERALVAMLQQFTAAVTPLFADYRKAEIAIREQVPKVALAVARKVAGPALDQNAYAVIEDIAARCCEAMAAEPKITIAVQEKFADALEKKLKEVAARMTSATDIVILRDPAMPPADCRIEWEKGGIERRTEQLWQRVEQAIGDMSVTAGREAQQQMSDLTPAGGESAGTGNGTATKPDPASPPAGAPDATKKE